MTKKTSKRKSTARKSKKSADASTESSFAAGVWSGSIARLRIYDSQTSTGTVFAYKAPGNNADGVGTTTDPNVIKALFRARDNGRTVMGYTNASNRIVWLDY